MMDTEKKIKEAAERYSLYGMKLAQENLWPYVANLYNGHLQKEFKRDPSAPPNIAVQAVTTLMGFVAAEAVSAFCPNEISDSDKKQIAADIMVKSGAIVRTLVKMYVKKFFKPEAAIGPNFPCACGKPSTHTFEKERHTLPVCDECDKPKEERKPENA